MKSKLYWMWGCQEQSYAQQLSVNEIKESSTRVAINFFAEASLLFLESWQQI